MAQILKFLGFNKRKTGFEAWRNGKARRALEILVPLAEQNDMECQDAVGRIFMVGAEDVDRDYVAAVKWLNLASRGGFEPAGKAFSQILGIASKDEIAEGRRQAFAEQQRIMNRERGMPERREPLDYEQLKSLDADTAADLGSDCNEGRNGAVDFVASYQYFLYAAERGHRIAQYNLGISLVAGKGVRADPDAAYAWFKKSAEQGWDQSLVMLAKAHISGEGAARDNTLALHYLDLATAAGNAMAPQIATMIRMGGTFIRS
jgi:TPR repeat protein